MAISKEEILSEIRKFVAANAGEIPGRNAFTAATGIKDSAWKGRHWVRWADALREAGYEANSMNQRIPDEHMLERLAMLILSLGYFPVSDEVNMHARKDPTIPAWSTIKRRYGGMPETATALLEFAHKNADDALLKLCQERIKRETPKPKPVVNSKAKPTTVVGFVYLKYSPSLRLYKIGKANDANKRGAGISLLLPEDLVPKHEIKTDCPFILEKYWEQEKRGRAGETGTGQEKRGRSPFGLRLAAGETGTESLWFAPGRRNGDGGETGTESLWFAPGPIRTPSPLSPPSTAALIGLVPA